MQLPSEGYGSGFAAAGYTSLAAETYPLGGTLTLFAHRTLTWRRIVDPEEFHRLVEYYTGLSDAELQHAFEHGPTGYREPMIWELVSALFHQRSMVRAAEEAPIRYSGGSGNSLDDSIVVTGADHDLLGTVGIFAWLIKRYGTMSVDWSLRLKSGHHVGERHIDIYTIQQSSGEERTFYFDISESYLKPRR